MSNKKSSAKMAGLKSLQYLSPNQNIAVAFGNGNKAIIDKSIDTSNGKTTINPFLTETEEYLDILTITENQHNYSVVNNERKQDNENLKGQADKITEKDFLDDLRFKDQLEQEIFDKTFQDNLRIQIAYNIFDIIKKLVPVSANLCYTLNSLDRTQTDSKKDIIGYNLDCEKDYLSISTNKKTTFDTYYNNAKYNFVYFGDLFGSFSEIKNTKKNNKQKAKTETQTKFTPYINEKVHETLLPINFFRNGISHFNGAEIQETPHSPISLFKKEYDDHPLIKDTINDKFKNAINQINDNFFDNEKNNFYIFTQSLNQSVNDELSQFYYDFVIKKTDKNLGFSIKKLRELSLSKEFVKHNFTVQDFSSFKNKFNKIFDALATYYFKYSENNIANNFVDELRFSKDENEKEKVYEKYTNLIFTDNQNPLKQSIDKMVGVFTEEKEKGFKSKTEISENIQKKVSENSFTDFSKLIYYVCLFISGKDINILLTNLINKFQVIDAFNKEINTLVSAGKIEPANYNTRYELFENSEQVAEELNIIKSISKMDLCGKMSDEEIYIEEALKSLGATDRNEVKKIISISSCKRYIVNNILNSRRYKYMVKYINSADIHKIMKCKSIVQYVINKMPETQIDSYFKGLDISLKQNQTKQPVIAEELTNIEKQNVIIDQLTQTDFTVFSTEKKGKLAESKKQLLALYYTVAYIFVKNLIQINSLYILAYYFRERDNYFLYKFFSNIEKNTQIKNYFYPKKIKANYDAITKIYVSMENCNISNNVKEFKIKKVHSDKLKRYIFKNNNGEDYHTYYKIYNTMRNIIDHLNIFSNLYTLMPNVDKILNIDEILSNKSKYNLYFQVYIYLLQTTICNVISADYLNNINNLNKESPESKKYSQLKTNNDRLEKTLEHIKKIVGTIPTEENPFFTKNGSPVPYNKQFLRALNIPFGYNVPRYKNLSYEKLFNTFYEDQ